MGNKDVDGLVTLLSDDVRLRMPEEHSGVREVRAALAAGPLTHRWRLRHTWANGQLAFGCYRWDERTLAFVGEGIDVLTIVGGRIASIDAFEVADLTPYALPETIAC